MKVTVTGQRGSATAESPLEAVGPGGQITVEEAIDDAQRADPSLLASSTGATLEEEDVAPALADGEEGLTATGTLTSSSVSKEVPGAIAVNTPEGELGLTPLDTSPTASTIPTVVSGTAAFFANTWASTDTIVRADPLGATMLLQLRSSTAPTSFSWKVGLGADQELRKLPGGAVAVVDSTEPVSKEASEEPTRAEAGKSESEFAEEESEEAERAASGDEREPAEIAEEELETEPEAPFENPAAALSASTSPGEPVDGELHPQDTQAQYESGTAAMASAEAQTEGSTLFVIEPPVVKDASGNTVPASFTVDSNTVTLTLKPSTETTYPILVDPTVASESDKSSKAKPTNKFRYGFSDQRGESFDKSGPAPEYSASLDHRLQSKPLQINDARLIVPYNVLSSTGTQYGRERLTKWVAAIEHDNAEAKKHHLERDRLEPFITLETACYIKTTKPTKSCKR